MSKKEEQLQPALPSFMSGLEAEGFEDVEQRTRITSYRISQGLSDVVANGIMCLGKIYASQDEIDLGSERSIIIFRKRKSRMLMNPKGISVACKGYGLDEYNHGNGRIRLYNAKDMPQKYLEDWGITPAMIADKENQVLDLPCAKCPYADWVTMEDGKDIPPKCNLVHEVFFFDVTEGLDAIPHVFSIPLTNKSVKETVRELDVILNQKLRLHRSDDYPNGLPICGGIIKLKADRGKNKDGQNFFFPSFDFERLVAEEDGPQFLMALKFLREYNEREAQYAQDEKVEETIEKESGSPWDNEGESSDTPWE